MGKNARDLCEKSLYWIMNYRRGLHESIRGTFIRPEKIQNFKAIYSKQLQDRYKLVEPSVKNDRHIASSFAWTVEQSQKIDEIGLYKWLETQNASGFNKCVHNKKNRT